MKTFVAALSLIAVVACGKPLFPTLDKIEQTVLTDLEAGDSDEQIASDVCHDLGGNVTTDAVCGGVAAIVVDVIQVLIDSNLLSSRAQLRAHAYLRAHGSR